MANTREQQLQAFARRAARVSRALWPTNVRRAIATGRMAQTRRRLIVTCRDWRSGRFKSRAFQVWRRQKGAWVPQGSPLPYTLTGKSRSMVGATLAAVALFPLALALSVLAVASMTILIAMRLWSLLLFFSMALAAIILLLVIVRIRISRTKSSQQGAERKSFPGILGKARFPDTPMPLEPPLVRVLETVDLSQTGVEHFLDLQESGNTGSYSLTSWKEAQTSLPGSTRE